MTRQSRPKSINGEELSPTKVGRSQSDGLLDSSFHSMGGSLGGGQTDMLVRDRSQTPECAEKVSRKQM